MDDPKATDIRGEINDDPAALYLIDHPDSAEIIPTFDIGPFLAGVAGAREESAARLDEISRPVGFFYLAGHGIPQEVIEKAFAASRQFHTQPESVKRSIPFETIDTLQCGYHPAGELHPNFNLITDAKPNQNARLWINREGGWCAGGDGDVATPVNRWPQNLPGFKAAVVDYLDRSERLGRQFLPLWATALRLPMGYFEKFFKTLHLTLSLLSYPPQLEIGQRLYGSAPHTDNSLMTFLAQDELPGLAVRMPSGHWRVVDVVPGTLLVNTGNLMVRWTNGEYLSTKHRVINANGEERYSIPVFFGPSGDSLIECLPTCTDQSQPPLYEPITYRNLRKWYYNPKG